MAKPSTSDFLDAADAAYSSNPAGTSGLSLLTNAAGYSRDGDEGRRRFSWRGL